MSLNAVARPPAARCGANAISSHLSFYASVGTSYVLVSACAWVCHSQVSVLSKRMDELSLFWGQRLPLTYHTMRYNEIQATGTRSSAIAERPRDASCQLKSCQLPRNSAETTCRPTTSPEPSISCL